MIKKKKCWLAGGGGPGRELRLIGSFGLEKWIPTQKNGFPSKPNDE